MRQLSGRDPEGRLTSWWERAARRPEPPWPLRGLARFYGAVAVAHRDLYRRGWRRRERLPRPVISVGNLVVGGAGKTTVVAWLARHLRQRGLRPGILSRGYGRRSSGPRVVSLGQGPVVDVATAGDEPYLLAGLPGVAVAVAEARRAAGEALLERTEVDLFLLDDGLQHHRLHRDVDLLVLRGPAPFGNGRVLPAGPLREPLAALDRCRAAVWLDPPPTAARGRILGGGRCPDLMLAVNRRWIGMVDARGRPLALSALEGAGVALVCGVGAPETVLAGARAAGARVVVQRFLRDHVWYGPDELTPLARRAVGAGARAMLTTEKDWVKMADEVRRCRLDEILPWWVVRADLVAEAGAAEGWLDGLLAALDLPGGSGTG